MPQGRSPTADEMQVLVKLRDAIAREVGQPKPDRAKWPVSFRLYGTRQPLIRADVVEAEPQSRLDDGAAVDSLS